VDDSHAAHLFRVVLAVEDIPLFASFQDFFFLEAAADGRQIWPDAVAPIAVAMALEAVCLAEELSSAD
jgi:hypothetical protein